MPRYIVLLLAVVLCFYGVISALWVLGHHAAYFAILRSLGMPPWDRPFLDMTGVLSWGECHRRGIDVLRANPCDPLDRLLNYGPLLQYWPFRASDTNALGIVQDVAFLITAPLVLHPRTLVELGVAIAACLSTVTIYALERANLDATLFVLVALAGAFSARGLPSRIFSYAIYFLGGLIKLYPFALLLMALRERTRLALTFCTLFALLIGGYLAYYWGDLQKIAHLFPPIDVNGSDMDGAYLSDAFGAYILPMGVASYFSLPAAKYIVLVLLAGGFGTLSLWLTNQIRSITADADWNSIDLGFLLAGAITLVGCFFSQSNLTYRVILAIFLIPGLFDLRRRAVLRPLKWILASALWLIIWCMWREMFGTWLGSALATINPDDPDSALWHIPAITYFLGRELVWWFLVSVMTAIVLAFSQTSPIVRAAIGALQRSSGIMGNGHLQERSQPASTSLGEESS